MTPSTENERAVRIEGVLRLSLDKYWSVYDLELYMQALNRFYGIGIHLYAIKHYAFSPIKNQSVDSLKLLLDSGVNEYFASYTKRRDIDRIVNRTKRMNLSFVFPLTSVRIQIQSPGIHDIAGASGVLQQLKEILFYYFPNKRQKIENEIFAIEAQIKYQEYTKGQVELLKSTGFSDDEIRQIMKISSSSIETLQAFIQNGRITGIEVLNTRE